MRTTISIDEDNLSVAHALSFERKVSMGRIISDLARKGFRGGSVPFTITGTGDLPFFVVQKGASPITTDLIKAAEDE